VGKTEEMCEETSACVICILCGVVYGGTEEMCGVVYGGTEEMCGVVYGGTEMCGVVYGGTTIYYPTLTRGTPNAKYGETSELRVMTPWSTLYLRLYTPATYLPG
jgi:hypothetical protein